jgi:hypothetical protein
VRNVTLRSELDTLYQTVHELAARVDALESWTKGFEPAPRTANPVTAEEIAAFEKTLAEEKPYPRITPSAIDQ